MRKKKKKTIYKIIVWECKLFNIAGIIEVKINIYLN